MNQTNRSTGAQDKDLSFIQQDSDALINFNDDSDNYTLNNSQQNFNQSYEYYEPTYQFLEDGDGQFVDSMELIRKKYRSHQKQKKKQLQNNHPNVVRQNNFQLSQGQNQQQIQQKVNSERTLWQSEADYCFYCNQKIDDITQLYEHEKACQKLYQLQDEFDADDLQTFGRKKVVEQKQQEINFFCSYCKVKLNVLELEEHEQQCQTRLEIEYQEIRCPYCGDVVIRSFLNDHLDECVTCIEDKFKKIDNIQECSICMSEITEKEIKLKCEHVFHKDCIQEWFSIKKDCPICRKKTYN